LPILNSAVYPAFDAREAPFPLEGLCCEALGIKIRCRCSKSAQNAWEGKLSNRLIGHSLQNTYSGGTAFWHCPSHNNQTTTTICRGFCPVPRPVSDSAKTCFL